MRKWLIGCLNSGMKQGAKLLLTCFVAWTSDTSLSIKTLVITVSVGFVWGLAEYVQANPIPDGSPVAALPVVPTPPPVDKGNS